MHAGETEGDRRMVFKHGVARPEGEAKVGRSPACQSRRPWQSITATTVDRPRVWGGASWRAAGATATECGMSWRIRLGAHRDEARVGHAARKPRPLASPGNWAREFHCGLLRGPRPPLVRRLLRLPLLLKLVFCLATGVDSSQDNYR